MMDASALAEQVLRDIREGAYANACLRAFRNKYLEVPLTGNTERLADWLFDRIV